MGSGWAITQRLLGLSVETARTGLLSVQQYDTQRFGQVGRSGLGVIQRVARYAGMCNPARSGYDHALVGADVVLVWME
jgi:hypothetical protein